MQSPIKMLTALCTLLGDYGDKSHPAHWRGMRAQWAPLPPVHLHKRPLWFSWKIQRKWEAKYDSCHCCKGICLSVVLAKKKVILYEVWHVMWLNTFFIDLWKDNSYSSKLWNFKTPPEETVCLISPCSGDHGQSLEGDFYTWKYSAVLE